MIDKNKLNELVSLAGAHNIKMPSTDEVVGMSQAAMSKNEFPLELIMEIHQSNVEIFRKHGSSLGEAFIAASLIAMSIRTHMLAEVGLPPDADLIDMLKTDAAIQYKNRN